ncbi:hypothetical protein RRG08_023423 [Elysia crispata]|uniref:Uncharacterized protein n=1 Tax=Elysia crispata TaxID=231223 RepID=A0AAE0YEG0_9GAST|nr:hypothetical protein RRG08_023423 [Elysia crispata]
MLVRGTHRRYRSLSMTLTNAAVREQYPELDLLSFRFRQEPIGTIMRPVLRNQPSVGASIESQRRLIVLTGRAPFTLTH